MPSSDSIRAGLTAIANDWRSLAVAWHLMLFGLLLPVVAGWRPSSRFVAQLLTTPVLSVSAVGWISGNPFNAVVFAALAVVLASAATGLRNARLELARPWLVPGAALVAFGSTYPHFLSTESLAAYIYAAPFGLLPCPTLSVVIGITLMCGNFGSTVWTTTLMGAALLYGVLGVFRLGVVLDVGLLAGAMMLAAAHVRGRIELRSVPAINARESEDVSPLPYRGRHSC